MSVRMRQYVERQIVGAFIDAALAHGHDISVHDSEEVVLWNSKDKAEIMSAMFTTDEDHVYLDAVKTEDNRPPKQLLGEAFFVYGNDGWDVLNDCHIGLGPLLAEADRLAEYWSKDGAWKEFGTE